MPKIDIEVEYTIGDIVYMITDPEQLEHLVVGYEVFEDCVRYIVEYMGRTYTCSSLQLSSIRDKSKAMGIDKKEDGTA